MNTTKSFHGLRRYRKWLLGPFSTIQVQGKSSIPFVPVSWADDGSAELLWVSCLIQRFGFERCLPLISAIAETARTRKSEKDRGYVLFFSNMGRFDQDDIKDVQQRVSDTELFAAYQRLFLFFQGILEKDKAQELSLHSLMHDVRPCRNTLHKHHLIGRAESNFVSEDFLFRACKFFDLFFDCIDRQLQIKKKRRSLRRLYEQKEKRIFRAMVALYGGGDAAPSKPKTNRSARRFPVG